MTSSPWSAWGTSYYGKYKVITIYISVSRIYTITTNYGKYDVTIEYMGYSTLYGTKYYGRY